MVEFPTYDGAMAERLLEADNHHAGGLIEMLGVTTVDVGPGRLVCRLPVTERLMNGFGAAHGGVVSALVDHVLGAVCLPVVPPGSWPATAEYKINLLAPAHPGDMEAISTIRSMSSRTAVVCVDVVNCGRTVALAQGTVTILPPRGRGPAG
jgi:1,4-dihydroxy-2-naphthoyl-CoA hydrolase